jgi:type I restriction enzyme S subunit
MIADLKPYPAMRDSGVPWLGEVPEHWEVRRNGRLFAQHNETGFAGLPILEVSLKTGVRVRDLDAGSRKQMMSDHDKYKKAASGDIAYSSCTVGLRSPTILQHAPRATTLLSARPAG